MELKNLTFYNKTNLILKEFQEVKSFLKAIIRIKLFYLNLLKTKKLCYQKI